MAGPLERLRKNISKQISKVIFSGQGFPIVLTITVLGILLVLFRMKSVEINYKIDEYENQITKAGQDNKDLRAEKARLLSVKSLREIAMRHNLKEPGPSQIIVVP